MVYKYEWRATKYAIPAQQAGEYIHDLSIKENGITAESLLEHSRDENALLHSCFEWDNTKAAEKYRLNQARGIISNLVAIQINEKPQAPVRSFVSVTETKHSEKGRFMPIVEAITNDKSRVIVLENATRELQQIREKYATLEELFSVWAAIDRILGDKK